MILKIFFNSFLYCFSLIIFLSIISCESENQNIFKRTQFIMGTLVEITVHESDKELAQKAINKSFNEMTRLEKIMSSYLPHSELSKLSALAGKESKVYVSPDLLKVVQRGVYWGRRSNGAFDISIGPAAKLSKFNSDFPTLPDSDQLLNATNLINYENIVIDGSSLSFKKKGMSLNLGAIGKGYAVDQAIGVLKEMKIKSGLINAGGDLMAFGLKKTKTWHIGIQHPRKPEEIIASLDVEDKAIATSGDYQRYFIKDKIRYHHMLDPKNGWPSNQTISATVIANTVMDADAASTALFILGENKGIALINSLKGFEGMIVSNLGSVTYSSGFNSLPGLSLEGLQNNPINN